MYSSIPFFFKIDKILAVNDVLQIQYHYWPTNRLSEMNDWQNFDAKGLVYMREEICCGVSIVERIV